MGFKMIKERLEKLRSLMGEYNIAVYMLTSWDYNLSPYVSDYFKSREYMSGFTGSNGTLVVTRDEAVLYTDSRYYIQAEDQLNGSGIVLYREDEKETTPIIEYIVNHVESKERVGFDGRTVSASFALNLKKELVKKQAELVCDIDLVSLMWEGRPSMPSGKAFLHSLEYAGEKSESKIKRLREALKEKGADIHLISTLDDIAYLLNIRGSDVHSVPVVLSYLIVTQNELVVFMDSEKLDEEGRAYLESLNAQILPYDSVYTYLSNYDGECMSMLLDTKKVNYRLCNEAQKRFAVTDDKNPTEYFKAVKNEVEVKNAKRARIKDGKAVCEFLADLKKNISKGNITEITASQKLWEYRKAQGAFSVSFDTICAYEAHGAIVHYVADEKTDAQIKDAGLLLIDSGGQYKEGTTDVTRTVAMGKLTPFQKKCYTLVLKGMLEVGFQEFEEGTCGNVFDEIARKPLNEHGLDYGHSTGHGVGSFLSVHEGPNGFSKRNDVEVAEGMITTDEPGVYLEGEFGVRIENELLCIRKANGLLGFEFLTMVPIDKEAIDFELMTSEDIQRLNRYHKIVRENILPIINDEAREYLLYATDEIKI